VPSQLFWIAQPTQPGAFDVPPMFDQSRSPSTPSTQLPSCAL
jgi:hypothetical protein